MYRKTISWMLLAFAFFVVLTPIFNIRPVKTDQVIDQSTTSGTITIQGKATLQESDDHSGISIQVWYLGSSAQTVAETTTGSDGSYQIVDVASLSEGAWYSVMASKIGYAGDSMTIYSAEATPGAVVVVDDMILHTQKWVNLDWVYQPDGTTNLSAESLPSGSVTLHSAVYGPGGEQTCGFIFSTSSVTDYVADVFFGDERTMPYSFLANNGAGGVHDMGAVSLNSVAEAPDISNGVGVYEFYNNQATRIIAGHTYCVVTKDGGHYAKIFVSATSPQLSPPVVSFYISPEKPKAGTQIMFNASASYSPNGKITGYEWNFGDGNITTMAEALASHYYGQPGFYSVTLKVTDASLIWNATSSKVTVHYVTDLNTDEQVNIQDITLATIAFGSKPGDLRWNSVADLNKDKIINIVDVATVAKDYGKSL